ncbi:histidine phosphatase family protein [Acidipropionibacterium jensenii]|uniref:Histidine phosphatase family protein n=1 Tax=Acidipropionibacterium jensenii TaxID=1749 RepID=A0A3Q9UE00_9ACTN|nr:histidine phosphatase family protein [Acidipropionibacterium jensenii]
MGIMILVRHPEAEKNVVNAFGGDSNMDLLTGSGRNSLSEVSMHVSAVTHGSNPVRVISSPADRALILATELASSAGSRPEILADLQSIGKGSLSGVTERVAEQAYPSYMGRLRLYRAGLLNGYALDGPGEELRGFETRVLGVLGRIDIYESPFVVLVAHRSTITALLMHAARLFHGYPTDFYGYVELPLSSVSLISWEDGILGVGLRAVHMENLLSRR